MGFFDLPSGSFSKALRDSMRDFALVASGPVINTCIFRSNGVEPMSSASSESGTVDALRLYK